MPSIDPNERIHAGFGHHRAGRLSEAAEIYREILDADPEHPDALHLLGLLKRAMGQPAEAVPLIQRALVHLPLFADGHANLGNALCDAGRHEDGCISYETALRLNPDALAVRQCLVRTLYALAKRSQASGAAGDALRFVEWLLRTEPDHSDGQAMLVPVMARAAELSLEAGRIDEALIRFHAASRHGANSAKCARELGMLARQLGLFSEAVHWLSVSEEQGSDTTVLFALANSHRDLGHAGLAEQFYRQALESAPDVPELYHTLGCLLQGQERVTEAASAYRAAVARRPDWVEPQWNLALNSLAQGQMAEGWAGYECRMGEKVPVPDLPYPQWQGEPLNGKVILLIGEQGFGDQIQFVRFAAEFAGAGATVDVLTRPELVPLFGSFPAVRKVFSAVSREDRSYDYWMFMMSAPHRLGTGTESVGRHVPYLAADPGRTDAWSGAVRRFADGRPTVGLVWAGSPKFASDARRSIQPAQIEPLVRDRRFAFVSLHRGTLPERLAACHNFLHLGQEISTFADTAAILTQFDILVSVDTSAAHLSAAMGLPTVTMLPKAPDWRWLLDGARTPWYPSMKLVRQTRSGDWPEVIARVHALLEDTFFRAAPASGGSTAAGGRAISASDEMCAA
jgi:tetratricopeptide (TPR) repeat protein